MSGHYKPAEALRRRIDQPGGLRERMDKGDTTAFGSDIVMGYDSLMMLIDSHEETIGAQAAGIERLRRERKTLGDAFVRLVQIYESEQDVDEYGNVPRPAWVKRAIAVLGPDGGDSLTTTYRQMDVDCEGWECTAKDCDMAWSLTDGGTPSLHHMRYCPGCGRRIMAEEPWEVDD